MLGQCLLNVIMFYNSYSFVLVLLDLLVVCTSMSLCFVV